MDRRNRPAAVAAAGLLAWLSMLALPGPALGQPAVSARPPPSQAVAALGRLQPRQGLISVAGPSQPTVVVAELLVAEGDRVEQGQVLAVLDTAKILEGSVAELEAELANARAEHERQNELHRNRAISDSQRDAWEAKLQVVTARLQSARAQLDQARVRAPISGQVIEVHAHAGERVGPEGILEIGKTDEMYAVAEVYETDIRWIQVGQRATVSSPALPRPLEGTVEWIKPKIGKIDVLGTDPAARTDARVVEVEIRLDHSEPASSLTNLQVAVEFAP